MNRNIPNGESYEFKLVDQKLNLRFLKLYVEQIKEPSLSSGRSAGDYFLNDKGDFVLDAKVRYPINGQVEELDVKRIVKRKYRLPSEVPPLTSERFMRTSLPETFQVARTLVKRKKKTIVSIYESTRRLGFHDLAIIPNGDFELEDARLIAGQIGLIPQD